MGTLQAEFVKNDLAVLSQSSGIRIRRPDKQTVYKAQERFIMNILNLTNMTGAMVVGTIICADAKVEEAQNLQNVINFQR